MRLNDISLLVLTFSKSHAKLVPEVDVIPWQDPGLREEVILFLVYAFHPHQVSSEMVLARYYIHARVVVDLLVEMHLG